MFSDRKGAILRETVHLWYNIVLMCPPDYQQRCRGTWETGCKKAQSKEKAKGLGYQKVLRKCWPISKSKIV